MRLVLAARSGDLLQEVAQSCHAEAVIFAADLREENAPQKLVALAMEKFGRLDLLVNNAGATKRGDFFQLTEEDWRDGFALKFYSAVRCSRAAPPPVNARGSIVNIVGVGGRTGSAEFAIGGAVNAALLNLTKVLADRGIKDGVRVNAINPGAITTDRLRNRISKLVEEGAISFEAASLQMAEQLGVGRFGEPAEIAATVAFLASDQANYCQGTILDVDGPNQNALTKLRDSAR